MAKSEKRPSWFKLFLHQKPLIDSVPDDIVGKALKAALRYFDTREESELEPLSMAVFCTIKPYITKRLLIMTVMLKTVKRVVAPLNPR